MTEEQPTKRTMFTLRRVSDQKWVDATNRRRGVTGKFPCVYALLAMADKVRMEVYSECPDFGIMEIVCVDILTIVRESCLDKPSIQGKLIDIGKSLGSKFSCIFKTIIIKSANDLILSSKDLDMQFFVMVGRVDMQSRFEIAKEDELRMHAIASFTCKGRFFLVQNHTSLSMLMLFDGFIPTFIYDLHTGHATLL